MRHTSVPQVFLKSAMSMMERAFDSNQDEVLGIVKMLQVWGCCCAVVVVAMIVFICAPLRRCAFFNECKYIFVVNSSPSFFNDNEVDVLGHGQGRSLRRTMLSGHERSPTSRNCLVQAPYCFFGRV